MLKKWRAIRGQPARSRIWRSLPRAEDRKAWVRPCGGGGGVCRHVVFSVTDTHDCTPYCTETWKYRSTSCAKDVPTLLWRSGSWARMGWVRAPSSQKEVPTGDAFADHLPGYILRLGMIDIWVVGAGFRVAH